ncbi:DUF485 domain-containing protein [Methylobacterium sp. WL103]|uniref:DUF485 domain-containing protein n=1 Tax=Methylobacterium sp. WL103 TaxID=2603891 RepID=UPI0011C92A1A|nr:DUF485 domain-containing protein [Methylobacterium sp. WL103]TXN08023.1 DUF485 domain-containing protein [Methylobacterium sp. WL103]
MNPVARQKQGAQNIYLGVALTLILVVAYFGFVALGAFAPALLAKPVLGGGTVTWAFAYGLFVMALGVILTGLYVLVVNRAEARLAGE